MTELNLNRFGPINSGSAFMKYITSHRTEKQRALKKQKKHRENVRVAHLKNSSFCNTQF